jgi:calcineurin-like phosphoesterase family protein
MLFFTADEHLNHARVCEYSNRPFSSVLEMEEAFIAKHNTVVSDGDKVFHLGDFAFTKTYKGTLVMYVSRLNGSHVFIRGDHDHWLPDDKAREIQSIQVDLATGELLPKKSRAGQCIVMSHTPLVESWPKSHYGSWSLHGHIHGGVSGWLHYQDLFIPRGKIFNVGVDSNNFFPVSLHELQLHMEMREDNPNLLPEDKRHANKPSHGSPHENRANP